MSRPKQRTVKTEPASARTWFRVGELAALLSVSRVTMWRWLKKAEIKSDGGKVWVSELRERMPQAFEGAVFAAAMGGEGVS